MLNNLQFMQFGSYDYKVRTHCIKDFVHSPGCSCGLFVLQCLSAHSLLAYGFIIHKRIR